MTHLSVNVNKVATLRNTRHLGIPSVVKAALICLEAGAAGITIHPRPDERHIRASDVGELAAVVARYGGGTGKREFNIEGNPFEGQYMRHVAAVKPDQCTLVPDEADSFTSNQGWKLEANKERLRPIISELKKHSRRVSLFMDATSREWSLAKELGADRVELYTEPYAAGFAAGDQRAVDVFVTAATAARAAGLGVNAGHDLNQENLGPLLAAIPWIEEVSIGHALIADALELGMAETVKRYKGICDGAIRMSAGRS